MNGRSEENINLHDIEAVTKILRDKFQKDWILVPDSRLPEISLAIVKGLNESRAQRK